MRRNGQNSTSGQFLIQNLKPPWAVSYSITNFGGTYYKMYACFEQKTAFAMQNFWNLGACGVAVTIFDETPKSTSLPDFTRADPFTRFFARRLDEKRTLQKVTERLYFTYLQGISHSAKFN